MSTRLFAVCGIVALLLVGTTGAVASGNGYGPAPGPDRGASAGTYHPGATAPPASSDDGGSDATASGGTASDAQSFTVIADNTEKCGRTCRDVTSTVTNEQDVTAEDVSVSTRIFAGKGTDGDQVWQGSEDVGTLGAGESHTATKRITLSFGDAWSVKRADGWITIRTTVESAEGTETLLEQRKVA